MNYTNIAQPKFAQLKKQALAALQKGELNAALEHISNAALVACYYMWGFFADPDLEELCRQIGASLANQQKHPGGNGQTAAPRCDVLFIASHNGYVGGHSEMVRQWMQVLGGENYRLAYCSTELVTSGYDRQKLAELVGGTEQMCYAAAPNLLGRCHEIAQFIHQQQPKLILSFINPHDAIATAALAQWQGKVPIVFVNHADHIFWLGGGMADLVVEHRALGEYYTQHHRGVNNTVRIPLTSRLQFDGRKTARHRREVRSALQIDASAPLSLSITTSYKILGSAWFYLDAMVAMLEQNPQLHHLLIVNSGKENFEKYLRGSGVEARFHILNSQKNLVPFYQAADIFIETFPFKGGMVRYDAFKAGLATVIVENPRMKEHTEMQGLPEGYPVVSSQEALLENVRELLASPALRQSRGKLLRTFYAEHFSEKIVLRQIKTLVQQLLRGKLPPTTASAVPPGPIDHEYYYHLNFLKMGDEAFFSGENEIGLREISVLTDADVVGEDVKAVQERLKYGYYSLNYRTREQFREARKRLEAGDFSGARALLEQVAAADPQVAVVYKYLAECCFQAEAYGEGIKYLNLCAGLAGEKLLEAEAQCMIGHAHMRMKNAVEAAGAFANAARLLPENPRIRLWQARALLASGAVQHVSDLLQPLLQNPGLDPQIRNEALEIRQRLQATREQTAMASPAVRMPRSDTPPRVSVIIPVFNKLEFTRQCLETIYLQNQENTPFEVIVVDNASSDGTEAYLKEALNRFPQLTIVTNVENTGFAAACNLGASKARGEYLLFLNNDTEPRPGWLDALVETLDRDTAVAAAGSKLLFPDGTIQHAGVVLVDDRRIGDPLNALHHNYRVNADRPEVNVPMEYPALTAACLMVRKLAFQLVGEFDEGFRNGYEDVDLCLKLGRRGWKLVYQPRSVLIHYESQSDRRERFGRVAENVRRLRERWVGVVSPQFRMGADGIFRPTADNRLCPYHPPHPTPAPTATAPAVGKSAPSVSIVILTLNQLEKTRECLESIAKHTRVPHEIIVVDNASKDGTRKFLKKWAGSAKHHHVIFNMQNQGFAAGNNQGIRRARGEYVVLLNNDTVVTREWLSGLLQVFRNHESAGLVGPKSNFVAGEQLEMHVPYQNERQLQEFAREYRRLFAGRTRRVHRLVGFCLAIKKSVLDEVGLLDERFGLGNYEDDDLSLRAALAGYQLWIAEDVFIHHYGNSSFNANHINYLLSLEKNRKIFLEKWQDLSEPQPLLIDILLEEARWEAQNNRPGAAANALQRAFALAPGDKSVAETYEKFLMRQGQVAEAIELLRQYVQHNPDDHEAFNALGMHYWRQKDVPRAIAAFQQAAERLPDHLDYLKNLADANLAAERFDAAIGLLLHLIQHFPADLEAYQKLANLYLEDNNPRSAYDLLKHAQKYHPRNEQLQDWLQSLARIIVPADPPGVAGK